MKQLAAGFLARSQPKVPTRACQITSGHDQHADDISGNFVCLYQQGWDKSSAALIFGNDGWPLIRNSNSVSAMCLAGSVAGVLRAGVSSASPP